MTQYNKLIQKLAFEFIENVYSLYINNKMKTLICRSRYKQYNFLASTQSRFANCTKSAKKQMGMISHSFCKKCSLNVKYCVATVDPHSVETRQHYTINTTDTCSDIPETGTARCLIAAGEKKTVSMNEIHCRMFSYCYNQRMHITSNSTQLHSTLYLRKRGQ